MKKHQLIGLILVVFSFFSSRAQISNVASFPDLQMTAPDLLSLHNTLEPNRAMPKITSIAYSGANCTVGSSTTDFWPDGTWFRGYYDYRYTANLWCDIYSGGYLSSHPLIRHTSEFGRSYVHFDRTFSNTLYRDRVAWAAEYLVDAQTASGGFTWWYRRPGQTTPNINEIPGVNYTAAYPSGHGLKTLADTYWHLRSVNDPKADDVYAAIEKAAHEFLTVPMNNSTYWANSTSNFRAFACWGLAAAYKVTGEKQYLQKALELADDILVDQETTGIYKGVWKGNSDSLKDDNGTNVSPAVSVYKEPKIWYHFIILRGLAETLSALSHTSALNPSGGHIDQMRNRLYSALEMGINHVIDHRFDATTNKMKLYFAYNGSYYNTGNSTYTFPANTEELVIPDAALETLGFMAYYAQKDNYYSSADRTNLIHCLNRAIAGETPGSLYYINNQAAYNDYIRAARDLEAGNSPSAVNQLDVFTDVNQDLLFRFAGTTPINRDDNPFASAPVGVNSTSNDLTLWVSGDFDGDGADEVLHKYDGSNDVFMAENGSFFGSNLTTVYSGSQSVERWVAGDFDGDGVDDLIFQFAGNSNVYFDQGPVTLSTSVSLGTGTIDQWLVGDFDGEGSEDLLYKFTGSTNIYKNTNDIPNFTSSTTIYSGSLVLDKWIAGDFHSNGGDMKDELIYKFTGPTIYKNLNLGTLDPSLDLTVYGGLCQLSKWIVGDFDGDLDDELLQEYSCVKKFYYSEDGTGLGANQVLPTVVGARNVFALDNWIVGDFDGDRDDDLIYWFNNYSSTRPVMIVDDVNDFGGATTVWNGLVMNKWLVGNFNGVSGAYKATQESLDTQVESSLKVFPNPFEDEVNIEFSLAEREMVNVSVFDINGRLIHTLINEPLEAGMQTIRFGINTANGSLTPGILFVKITSDHLNVAERVVYLGE